MPFSFTPEWRRRSIYGGALLVAILGGYGTAHLPSAPAPAAPAPAAVVEAPAAPAVESAPAVSEPVAAPAAGPLSVPFDTISTIQGLSLTTLTSQHALTDWGGSPVVVSVDSGKVIVVLPDGSKGTVGSGSGPSIAEVNGRLQVAYVSGRVVKLATSTDGRTWTSVTAGTLTGQGAALPVVCGTLGAAWTDQATADGDGPLYVAGKKFADHAATVSCTNEGVYWRDQRDGASKASIRRANLDGTGESVIVSPGYDASAAACGDLRIVGYHTGTSDAYVTISRDGGKTWAPTLLDDSGKFVSVACSGSHWLAAWGDYTDKAAASDARNSDSKRRLGVVLDGTVYKPAGDETSQVKGSTAFIGTEPAVAWGDVNTGAVKVAQ